MRVHYLLSISLLFAGIIPAIARAVPPKSQARWANDGVRSCIFDDGVGPVKCTQYHQTSRNVINRWMWKSPDGHEVRYTSRIGLIGVGNFTIGELFDGRSSLRRHLSKNAGRMSRAEWNW